MPRIMTMNGDHQSVATAPLDLSTTKRGNAGSRSPDCRGCARDARVTAGSPAPPACTGTDSLDIQCAAVRSALGAEAGGAARKRPADKSFRLPFRKRKINLETEAQAQSPTPPELGERFSTARDADAPHRFPSRLESDAEESRIPTQRTLDHVYPLHLVHPYAYGHYQVCCLQTHQPVVQLSENLQSSVSLATRQDEDGDTALHIAVVQGELSIVYKLIELLLWAGKGLDIYNNLRQTPLHLAVITQQVDMVGALLRAKADPTALDRNGQTALHLCCEYNQSDCMSVVLASLSSSSSTCLEIKNYEGLSPLHLAVLRGQKDLARMLLKAGADINAMDIKSGQSPLMHAVETNNVNMVHFLIENGCDVNTQSYSGNTALHSACGRGQVDTVRLLLKSGADSSIKNYHNDTPVMVAKNKKITDVLRGRGQRQLRDPHFVSVSPHGTNFTENDSSSPSHSRDCSPSTIQHIGLPHYCASRPPTPSSGLVFPFC